MANRFDDFAHTLTSLGDAAAIWKHTAEFANNLGFSYSALTMATKTDFGLQSAGFISDLPEEFCSTYVKQGLVSIDPFLNFRCNTLSAQGIIARDLPDPVNMSSDHKIFLEQAAETGAVNGLGVPVRTSQNEVFGGWVFSSTEEDRLFDLLNRDHSRDAHLAGVLAYERMVALGLGKVFKFQLLSERERECLLWLCAGLRVSAIADKLGISNSAVRLYLTNGKLKLGAKTREQAIARAIFSGEITL